ncbi:peptidase inhibitor family I36 protein [Streptomyces sp. IBSNAI002]|uniref:peptidase inhibitor family I36 protein n=1 Tax=Streptomyces sp. IBSNAI002 TaxID=3457500 RepID=UPI003FD1169B
MPVTLYSDSNYAGKNVELAAGRYKLDADFNDTISSLQVPANWSVTLYDAEDFTGEKVTLTSDTANLAGVFDNKASSIEVTHKAAASTKESELYYVGGDWIIKSGGATGFLR